MTSKCRLDAYLADRGLCESREKAKAAIMAGVVYVNGAKAAKPGDQIREGDKVEVRGKSAYVSRGGHKLEKAMEVFPIDLNERICMDVGASTGGFTDCMLQNGAKTVFSIDVGYGQLAWKLRTDPRVVNMERTNIRFVEPEHLSSVPSFASIDVAFISLRLVLPVVFRLLSEDGECVALVKPQFEAGREKVGKKGVVRDPAVHVEVLKTISAFAQETGFTILGLDFSPIKGPEGNIEYLLFLTKKEAPGAAISPEETVRLSHQTLDERQEAVL